MPSSKLEMLESSNVSKSILVYNQENGWPDIPDQKKVFAYLYLREFNQFSAAEEAGFERTEGTSLLREPLLSAFIEYLKEEQRCRLMIDADMVRTMWLEMIPVLAGKESAPRATSTGQMNMKHFDSTGLINAMKELGRIAGIYSDADPENQEAPSLNITYNVNAPKDEVIVTRGKEKEDAAE